MNSKRNNHNLIRNLTIDEKHAFEHLSSIDNEWADYFNTMLLVSRDKVSQRLITSLRRENLVYSRAHSEIITTQSLHFPFETEQKKLLKIQFPKSQKTLFAPITGEHAFDRIDVEGPFYFEDKNEIERIYHPDEILSCILTEAPELNNEASAQFSSDINNSVANMAIALSFQAYALANEYAPLWQLIANDTDSYLRSEQAVVEGHPLHPGAKLRKGMTPKTAIDYSSEFGHAIGMKFILIQKDIAKVKSLSPDYNELIYTLFEGLYDAVVNTVGVKEMQQYYVMVVHPWQYNEILGKDYDNELQSNQIIPIDYQLDYYAGLSFRTLMPKKPVTSPHIKLSTNVHITGEIRTLSEQTTINGPLVTNILNDIKYQDLLFQQINADTIDEVAGIHFYNSNDSDEIQTTRSEQLGTLFRTNIYELVQQNATPVIPSSLVANYPNNQETPLTTLIRTYEATHHFDSYEKACIAWFERYSQAMIDIALPLYVKYGIALEAHLQNTIAAFNKDGSLNKLYIRDFEGLRIEEAYLNEMGYSTNEFHEKSLILTDQAQTVFNKVFYSSIQNHLGELIVNIAKSSTALDLEQTIWSLISDNLNQKLIEIAQTMENPQRISQIRSILFAPKIDYKCVTTMRLEDEADYYTYIQVSNPLYRKQ